MKKHNLLLVVKMKLCDRNVILTQYKIATYFGFPWIFGISSTRLRSACSKCYPMAVLFIYLALTTACLCERIEYYKVIYTPAHSLSDILQLLSEVSFLSACLVWPAKRFGRWKAFWSDLKTLDKNLKKLNFERKRNPLICGATSVVCFTVVFSIHAWEMLNWYHMGQYSIIFSYLNFRIVMYYQLFVTILIYHITKMFKVRYEFLHGYIHKVIGKINMSWGASQNDTYFTIRQLQEISKLYATIHGLIKLFNNILGWHICFIITNTVLTILNYVTFGLMILTQRTYEQTQLSVGLIINMVNSAIYLVSTFF